VGKDTFGGVLAREILSEMLSNLSVERQEDIVDHGYLSLP